MNCRFQRSLEILQEISNLIEMSQHSDRWPPHQNIWLKKIFLTFWGLLRKHAWDYPVITQQNSYKLCLLDKSLPITSKCHCIYLGGLSLFMILLMFPLWAKYWTNKGCTPDNWYNINIAFTKCQNDVNVTEFWQVALLSKIFQKKLLQKRFFLLNAQF